MHALIAFALKARAGIVAFAALALLLGVFLLRDAPYDVLPEFVPPQVVVETEAAGFDPEQVEQLVTHPLEAAVNGAPGLASMRSESIAGLSVITLGFEDGVDAYRARQGVAEKLANAAAQLPPSVAAPQLSPLTSATMDVLKIGLVSDRLTPMALRGYADSVLKPALLGVAGVARATVFGGEVREARIDVQADRLLAAGLALDDVANALRRVLATHAGGFLETASQRLDVRIPLLADPNALAGVPLAVRGARTLTVGDVARIGYAPAPAFGDALIDGRPGVLITLSDQYGANTLAVTRALEARLAELAPGMRELGIRLYPELHRPATFVETALANLGSALLLGAVLVAVVLLAFLRDWRAALISFVAIPLSLLAASLVIWKAGYSINTMTLGGFAVALGVLVDDAIIGVENVMRRLRERGADASLRERLDIVLAASVEVRGAMVYATVVVLLVFVPAILQPGVSGRFIAPLAWAFVLSVLASLLVALTVTPAMAGWLLGRYSPHAEPRWIGALRRQQARLIAALVPRAGLALLVLGVLFCALVALAMRLPGALVPEFREGHFVVQLAMRQPGAALSEMRDLGVTISARLKALPFVATVEEQIGRSELGEDTWTVDRGEFHIELKHDAAIDQSAAEAAIRATMDEFPSVESEVLTFIGDRLSETLSGENSAVVVRFYGSDPEALDAARDQAAKVLAGVHGVTDLHAAAGIASPSLRLDLDTSAAAAAGIDPAAPAALLEAATQGMTLGHLYADHRMVAAVLHLALAPGDPVVQLGRQLLPMPAGGYLEFGDVARLHAEAMRPLLRHEEGRRFTAVAFGVAGRDAQAVIADARSALTAAHLPGGVDFAFGGVAAAEAQAHVRLWIATLATLAVIVVVLAYAFARRRHAGLVLLNLPFALIGALAALLLSRLPLSLGAAVGLVTVFGISARNAILLLTHFEQLAAEKDVPIDLGLVQRGAAERLVPVLMTALVSALGLVPLAFGLGRAGYEIEAPLAIVVLGGLATSTVLSLLLLPALAARPVREKRGTIESKNGNGSVGWPDIAHGEGRTHD